MNRYIHPDLMDDLAYEYARYRRASPNMKYEDVKELAWRKVWLQCMKDTVEIKREWGIE